MKCPVSLAKTCIQHMTVAHFYLVVSGTYWGGSELKCLGVLLKGHCSQSSILNQLCIQRICIRECNANHAILTSPNAVDTYRSTSPHECIAISRELPSNTTVLENLYIKVHYIERYLISLQYLH